MKLPRILLKSSLLLLLSLALSGCASIRPDLPAIGESGKLQSGKIVWHDLLTSDMERAAKFYQTLFGWRIEPVTRRYSLVYSGDRLIAGIAEKQDAGERAHWIGFISVQDVDAGVERIRAAGGKVHLEPFDLPNRGRVALVADPQGAAFGLIHATGGDPGDAAAEEGSWLWHEIWADDPEALVPFYRTLLGPEVERMEWQDGHRVYRYLQVGGRPRMGLITKPGFVEAENVWLPYIRTSNPEKLALRAQALGGRVLLAPSPEIRQGSVAMIADPTGGVVLLQRWDQ